MTEKETNFRDTFDKLLFTDKSKKEEWDNMEPDVKKYIRFHLIESCKKMENSLSVEMLAHCINDMNNEIQEIKNTISEMQKENKKST